MADGQSQETYDAHRQRLIAASVSATAAITSGVTLLYATTELLTSPAGFWESLVPYSVLVVIPWLVLWLVRGP
ncbi:MAG TPA: hypothetical protein VMT89_01580, partial [Candidatus Acidoferrales bacterium]|nr:hypothetical protein [Candidatus Acidoferrales bacterium]